jgi:hypothetical protein
MSQMGQKIVEKLESLINDHQSKLREQALAAENACCECKYNIRGEQEKLAAAKQACLNFYRSAEDYSRLLEAVNGVLNSDSLHACPEDTAGDTLPETPDLQAVSEQLPTMDET